MKGLRNLDLAIRVDSGKFFKQGSLPRRRSYGFVAQSFEPPRMSAWEATSRADPGVYFFISAVIIIIFSGDS